MTTTGVFGQVLASNKYFLLQMLPAGGIADATEIEVKILTTGGSLVSFGEALNGLTLQSLRIMASTPSLLQTVKLYDSTGKVIGSWKGQVMNAGAELTAAYAMQAEGLNIPLRKGMVIKVLTQNS